MQASGALHAARDRSEACEKALKAAERQLADLEVAGPKARMEAQAEADKAADIQQRLEGLQAATKVCMHSDLCPSLIVNNLCTCVSFHASCSCILIWDIDMVKARDWSTK